MRKFTGGDSVRIAEGAPAEVRRGSAAAVVGVSEGSYLQRFPEGVVYTVEFEDGTDAEVHEDYLTGLPQTDARQ